MDFFAVGWHFWQVGFIAEGLHLQEVDCFVEGWHLQQVGFFIVGCEDHGENFPSFVECEAAGSGLLVDQNHCWTQRLDQFHHEILPAMALNAIEVILEVPPHRLLSIEMKGSSGMAVQFAW